MKSHFVMFAGYNRWANERVYDAAEKLGDAEYRADLGAFFGSLHRTLNHILVGDRVWMYRFTGEGPLPSRLDEAPFDDLPRLAAARRAEDQRIIDHVAGLDEAALEGTITYRTLTNPTDVAQGRAHALAHFFNHQTHHRGQAHMLLTVAGGRDAAPALDLALFQRAQATTAIGEGSR